MRNQFCTANELHEFINNPGEIWFISKKLVCDPMHVDGFLINLSLRIDIHMKRLVGQSTVDQLDATDFDDAVAIFWIEAGGFGIKNYLSHVVSAPRLANWSARSLPS